MTEEQPLFGLTGEQLIFFKAQTIANGNFSVFKMNAEDALQYFKNLCRNLLFDEMEAETHSYAFYLRCQNGLFEQKIFSSKVIQTLPPFNEFGRRNITKLLQAWENGGESFLEEMFWEIFSKGWENERDKLKPIEQKLFELRHAAFNKYGTVQRANHLIDQVGLEESAKLSAEDFLEKLEIRISRLGLTESEKYCLVANSVLCGKWQSVGLNRDKALTLIEEFFNNINSTAEPEETARRIYYPTQNALMAFRKDDFYTIQNEPPFSEFGRENMIRFLTAWEKGKKASLELLFNHIFSQDWEERREEQGIIKILSGDGQSIENPVKFSTSDLMKRVRAESWYMSYLFGKEGQNWEKGIHFTTSQPDTHKMISVWNAEFSDGTSKTIYFDTNKDD